MHIRRLRGIALSRAALSLAELVNADLRHADLSDADLFRADLHDAFLDKADLSGAFFQDTNLNGATGVSNEELEKQALSLKGATMPNGQKYEEWLKER